MTKLELIDKISKDLKLTKKNVTELVNALFEDIKTDLDQGNKVVISNFGTFTKTKVKDFQVFNPQTGETMEIKDSYRVHFTASKNKK